MISSTVIIVAYHSSANEDFDEEWDFITVMGGDPADDKKKFLSDEEYVTSFIQDTEFVDAIFNNEPPTEARCNGFFVVTGRLISERVRCEIGEDIDEHFEIDKIIQLPELYKLLGIS